MNVLSLFDGMSCLQIALNRLGVKVDKYYASEVDKFAIQTTMSNFPNTIQLGDVRDINVSKLEPIEFVGGGSPCTDFSFSGKRNGMQTKEKIEIYTLEKYLELKNEGFEFEGQSYLFWEYIRILTDIRKYNPDVKFLLENVEMGKKWERVLSDAIGLRGVHINSALVSAQSRKRIYWSNIRTRQEGLFGEVYTDIPQPKDEGILLKDILESDVDEKYYLSESITNKIFKGLDLNGKGNTLRSSGHQTQSDKHNFYLIKIDKKGNIKDNQDKASCFTAGGNSGGNHSDMDLIVYNTMPRSSKSGKGGTGQLSRNDGKTYYINTSSNTNVIQLNPSKESGGKQPYQQNIVYDTDGKMVCLDTDSGRKNILENNIKIRRLTTIECCRLQTVPDDYFIKDGRPIVSETQQYRQLGNGWTIAVICHILLYLPK